MKKVFTLIFFIIISNSASIFPQELASFSPIKFSQGDSLEWKNPDYSDSHWKYLFDEELFTDSNFIWIRAQIVINKQAMVDSTLLLVIDMNTNYEVYWNGKFLGKNFEGDSITTEEKGVFDNYYQIHKNDISPINVLAIRSRVFDNDFYLETLNIETEETYLHSNFYLYGYMAIIILLNILLLYLTFTYFQNLVSNQLKILITLILFISSGSFFLEFMTFFGWVSYSILKVSAFTYDLYGYLILYAIFIHTLDLLDIPNRKTYLILAGIFYADAYFMDAYFIVPLAVTLISSFIFSLFQLKNNHFESFLILIFIFILSLVLMSNLSITLSDVGTYVIIYFLVSIFMKTENKNRMRLAEMRLQKSILEGQLLKKIIQPHYLMNSLNAMVGLFEESTNDGLKFLNEITNEFRMFLDISGKKLITIREELKLCEHHLNVMQYRKEREYVLENKITQINKKIPPAIFHTIVENGITHDKNCKKGLQFIFNEELKNGRVTYEIICKCINCKIKNFDEIKVNFDKSKIKEGAGLKYIRNRLKESYDDAWNLDYYGNDNIWVTKIEIFNGVAK